MREWKFYQRLSGVSNTGPRCCEESMISNAPPRPMTTITKNGLLFLVHLGRGLPDTQKYLLCSSLRKASFSNRSLDNFYAWSFETSKALWSFLTCRWTCWFHTWKSQRFSHQQEVVRWGTSLDVATVVSLTERPEKSLIRLITQHIWAKEGGGGLGGT